MSVLDCASMFYFGKKEKNEAQMSSAIGGYVIICPAIALTFRKQFLVPKLW